MSWKASTQLMDTIRHYANFPATGVSLRQMVQFGEKPSIGEFQRRKKKYSTAFRRYSQLFGSCLRPFEVRINIV